MKKYNVNNDYSYLARMQTARAKEEYDYYLLKKESQMAMTLSIVGCIDMLIAIFAILVLYS